MIGQVERFEASCHTIVAAETKAANGKRGATYIEY
jgi:hypothetical protein